MRGGFRGRTAPDRRAGGQAGRSHPEDVAALRPHRGAPAGRRRPRHRLRGILHTLDHALTDSEGSTMSTPVSPVGDELHRRLGADLFNDTWRLMELADRSPADDVLMIHQ